MTVSRATQLGRAPAVAAWSIVALAAVATVVDLWLHELHRPGEGAWDVVGEGMATVPFSVVGALIVARRPLNAVGWLFCAAGLAGAVLSFTGAYAVHGLLTAPGSLPAAASMGWVANTLWALPNVLLLLYLPLLYPDGRLPSKRWRPVAWGGVVLLAMTIIASGLTPGRLRAGDIPLLRNPWGIPGAGLALDVLDVVALYGFIPLALAAHISLVRRFRRATGRSRQQLKWFVFTDVTFVCVLLALPLTAVLPVVADAFSERLYDLMFGAIILGYPTALGMAVLRYRLYEIDRIISRTVSYGSLTAVLGVVYIGVVWALRSVLTPVTGESQLSVAGSTLVVAALFGPLRRRVQAAVDRRFNRARYDAARTAESFSARLRNEVDLNQLSQELLSTVEQTVQPAGMSMWLRPSPAEGERAAQGLVAWRRTAW